MDSHMLLPALLALHLAVAPPPSVEEDVPVVTQERAVPMPAPPTSELRTARFSIRYTEKSAGAAKFLAGEIEHVRDQIAEVIGRDWGGVTEVRLGYGRSEYEALAVGGERPPSWAVALAWPDQNIVLVEAHSLVQGDGQQTLRHELAHVALGQLGKGWPRWFQEGLAQELTGERKYRLSEYATLARAVRQDRVFRFDDLAAGFPARPDDVEIAYAQSAAFVAFLHERYGADVFGRLIDGVGLGQPFETAFARAFHSSLSHEERLFKDELPSRYPIWPIVTGGTTLWAMIGVLLVVAWARKRRDVARHRDEQARQEAMEDAAMAILTAVRAPVNEDQEPPELPRGEWPWMITILRSGKQ